MNDREMLELAAKASGNTVYSTAGLGIRSVMHWNPLEHDADAFRLVMALDMTVNCNRDELTVIVQSWRPKLCKAVRTNNTDSDVRRAIVEVAAMIGKLLK